MDNKLKLSKVAYRTSPKAPVFNNTNLRYP